MTCHRIGQVRGFEVFNARNPNSMLVIVRSSGPVDNFVLLINYGAIKLNWLRLG